MTRSKATKGKVSETRNQRGRDCLVDNSDSNSDRPSGASDSEVEPPPSHEPSDTGDSGASVLSGGQMAELKAYIAAQVASLGRGDPESAARARNALVVQIANTTERPVLKSVSRKALSTFVNQRHRYVSKMRSIQQEPEELKTMVDTNLLDLIATVYCSQEKTIDQLTNEDVESFIENGLKTSTPMLTESRLLEILRPARMDMRIDDHVERYHDYLVKVQKVDQQHGIRAYFKTNTKLQTTYISGLIGGVRPYSLQGWVRARLEKLPNKADRVSEHNFWRILKEGNQHCADFAPKRNNGSVVFDQRPKTRKVKRFGVQSRNIPVGVGGRTFSKRLRDSHGDGLRATAKKRHVKQLRERCFVEGCKENHRIIDHPGVTEDQRKRAFEARERAKNGSSL